MNDHSGVFLRYQEPTSNQRILGDENIPSDESLKARAFSKKTILPPVSPDKINAYSHSKISDRDTNSSPLKLKPRKISIDDEVSDDYKLAKYETSKQFFKHEGYFVRRVVNNVAFYQPTGCTASNIRFLNQFHSTGVYFYFQLLKRLLFLLLFCSCLSGVQLYNNYYGTKLSGYTKSFSTNLAYFSLGNNDGTSEIQMYLQCGLATIQALALVFFYIQWRVASNQILNQYLENPNIIEPQRYALTVSGIDRTSAPQSLAHRFKEYLQDQGYNVYECEVIQDYDNNFNDYIKLEKLINQIQQQKFLIQQGKGSTKHKDQKQADRDELLKEIEQSNRDLKPLSIIVHFQTKMDKARFIHSFKHSSKQNTCCASFNRCFCCFRPQENELFENQLVLLESERLGRPDDIYWENMDATFCSRFWRVLIGVVVIVVSLVVTSTVIACCILYASGSASCLNYVPNSSLSSVVGNQNLLYCFCQQNILSSDTAIVNACGSVNRTILINNALLIVSSVASALSNIILVLIVELIIHFMKPVTRSKEYEANFVIIIIATLINSCFLPLVLNASIFGYTPNAYLRIFNFINFTNVKIVSDFVPDWYVFISPYYINLFIVAIILPWVNLFKCMIVNSIRRCLIKGKIGEILQKTADATIIGYKFDVASQNALLVVNTLICFTYSTALPLLPLLHFLSICSIYITNKICLLRYSRRVSIDEDINNIIIHIIPFIVILNICFSIWALTADTLFPVSFFNNTSFSFSLLSQTEFRRAFYFMPLLALLAVVVVFLLIDWFLIRLFGLCCKNNAIHPESIDKRHFFSQKSKNRNILSSYKFSKNPDYKHVISIVESMLRKRYAVKQ